MFGKISIAVTFLIILVTLIIISNRPEEYQNHPPIKKCCPKGQSSEKLDKRLNCTKNKLLPRFLYYNKDNESTILNSVHQYIVDGNLMMEDVKILKSGKILGKIRMNYEYYYCICSHYCVEFDANGRINAWTNLTQCDGKKNK